MFSKNMTEKEEYEKGRYYFGLGYSAPYSWGIHPDINMDIPEQFRSFVNYRTTLGHKINHKFAPSTNSQFEVVKHVLFGPIVSIGINDASQ